MKTLQELGALSNPIRALGDLSVVPQGMAYDSREVRQGDLFVALRGGYFDGHAFIRQAVEQGAVAVASEEDIVEVPTLVYSDMRASLPELAAAFFDYPGSKLNIAGITGTDGKTTTSYLTESILAAEGLTTGMIGTVSVKIAGSILEHETRQTTPESLDIQRYLARMRDAQVEWAILEATSHGLAAHRLDCVDFAIGAVTNVTHEHLEFHGSIEAYRQAKASLIERVGAIGGHAVINLDDRISRSFADLASGGTVLTYSRREQPASIMASDIECDASGSTFRVDSEWGSGQIRFPYPGDFNVENALCAVGIAMAAGVDFQTTLDALESVAPVPGRMAQVDEGQPFSVIVDYAHTPESLEKIRWIPELEQSMNSEDAEMRFVAAVAAGSISDSDLVPALARLVDDEDGEVRYAAIASIGQIGGQGALRVLRNLRARDGEEDELVESAYEEALLLTDPLSN